jgi:hypothetical protein
MKRGIIMRGRAIFWMKEKEGKWDFLLRKRIMALYVMENP